MKNFGWKLQKRISFDSESDEFSDIEMSENKLSDNESENGYESTLDDVIFINSENETDNDEEESEIHYRENIFKILDSYCSNSFYKFLEENIPKYMKETKNIFCEKITEDVNHRNKFVINDVAIFPPRMNNDLDFMYPFEKKI
jgi:hypothetical protein